MRTPKARREALIDAGFATIYRGRTYPDVAALAEATSVSKSSIYYWINGSGGRFVDVLIRQAIRQAIEERRGAKGADER